MLPSVNIKSRVAMVAQTASSSANTYGNVLDVRSFDSATFHVGVRSATASGATNSPSVVTIEHADDTNATSFSAISGFPITAGLPTAVNDTAVTQQDVYGVLGVDLRGKKRYLRIGIRSAGSNLPTCDAVCVLDAAGQAPTAAAAAGARFFRAV